MVKVDPAAVRGGDDALGPEDDAVLQGVVQGRQSVPDLLLGVLLRGLAAPAGEDLVGVMVMVSRTFVMVIVTLITIMMMLVMFFITIMMMVMMVVFLMLVPIVVMMAFALLDRKSVV